MRGKDWKHRARNAVSNVRNIVTNNNDNNKHFYSQLGRIRIDDIKRFVGTASW